MSNNNNNFNDVPSILKDQEFPVDCEKFGLGLAWTPVAGREIDLDVQALAFDKNGKPMDAVYYNNMKAFRGGLTHSGDETSGEKGGFDEIVWVKFSKLPEELAVIVFVVACYKGGNLSDARDGKFVMLENKADRPIGQFRLDDGGTQVDLVAALVRKDPTSSQFHMRLIEQPAEDGQHFMDIMEPTIGTFIRTVLPGAPRRIKAAFAMDKGTVVDLPKSRDALKVKAALGWDTSKGDVDLDVSAVLLDQAGSDVGCVFFNKTSAPGIQHSGDNRTGEGAGDDEVISIDFTSVQSSVHQLFFVINIYTKGRSFAQVANPYCRVLTADGSELCRYQLADAGREAGLMIARFVRAEDATRWAFQAIGKPCRGNTFKDSLPERASGASSSQHQS
eukprot:TRINITY_DN15232_c0_g1_i28.p1 TRINITY_DN15232_c0_g1~~TRINITY_DN15232_c0_g1_i28.p1  ORF type:complete len:390 (+),score=73.64 TRINITY_DN15232_c0_g1_i28:84-1253(+)